MPKSELLPAGEIVDAEIVEDGAVDAPIVIDAPGFYDLTSEVYHGDPIEGGSLSYSSAKVLLQPAGPARFDWRRKHPRAPKREFDLGHAVHTLILGKGEGIVVAEGFDSWRKAEAQKQRDAAYAAGLVPLLPRQWDKVKAIAVEALAHPLLAEWLAVGRPEVSMFWRHPAGIWLRGQMDWMHPDLTLDVKTTTRLGAEEFSRHAFGLRYGMQGWLYRFLRAELEGAELKPFYNAVVEVADDEPPLVHVVEMDADYFELGRIDMERAIALYGECTQTGHWPAYPTDITPISPPAWALHRLRDERGLAIADEIETYLREKDS